jgi:hypothetical protein
LLVGINLRQRFLFQRVEIAGLSGSKSRKNHKSNHNHDTKPSLHEMFSPGMREFKIREVSG